MATVVLYSYFRSSASYRVRIALNLKEIDFEYREVNLLADEQNSDAYNQVNPKAEVPTLLIDNLRLTQSLPIMEYLDESRPTVGVSLLPKDAAQRVHCRRLAEIINSGIQPIQNLSVLKRLPEEERKKWAAIAIIKGFEAFEKELQYTAGKYCVGDELSMADICLVPQVANATRFSVDMTPFPTIRRINETCLEIDAFKRAHPSVQPDAK